MVRQADNAEVRLERGEVIVRDLGTRGGDHREQRALAGVRLAQKSNIGDELENELELARLALCAGLPFTRGLVRRRREVLVAAPTSAPLGDEQGLIELHELTEDFTRFRITDFSSGRNR